MRDIPSIGRFMMSAIALTNASIDTAKEVRLMWVCIVDRPSAVVGVEHEQWLTDHLKHFIDRLGLHQGGF